MTNRKYFQIRILRISVLLFGIALFSGCSTFTQPFEQPTIPVTPTNSVQVNNFNYPATFVTLPTRPEVQLKVLLIKPQNPTASIVLFAGGHGKLNLTESDEEITIGWGRNNFLIRNANTFASHGFTVAVVDTSSDYENIVKGFRNSAEHVNDQETLIAYLQQQNDNPVWLVGTSRGTESAAYVALYSRKNVDGLVLTSSMTVENYRGQTVTSLPLQKISVPTLVIAHKEDQCYLTPAEGAEQIKRKLTNTKRVELRYFKGGLTPLANPCQGLSAHGFYGIDDEVVASIANFITSHRSEPAPVFQTLNK